MRYILLCLFLQLAIATDAVGIQSNDSLRMKRMTTMYFVDNKAVDSVAYSHLELKLIEDIKSRYSIGQQIIYRDEASQLNIEGWVKKIVYNGIIVEYDSVAHQTFFIRQKDYYIPKLEIVKPFDQKIKITLMKRLYNNEVYDYQQGDRYVPMMNSAFSFLVPGSGQLICGDVLGGIGYLSGGAFTLGLAALGAFSLSEEMYSPILFYTGIISHIGIRALSAIDAHKLAVIKNMYGRDRKFYNLNIVPYIKKSAYKLSNQPEGGITLSLRF